MCRLAIFMALVGLAAAYPSLQDAFDAVLVGSGDAAATPRTGEVNETACLEPVQPGVCRGAIKRWAFDQNEARCRSFPWGGCGGTANK
ncbi:putative Kunitz-type serine protease inhibitor [Pollicipes pollicipes]|uniref:putative Kunitz-type serine protease inhibitor n=1 Tax=Pollicipes pollicipes TaxID=41117 RepID=UPI00188546AF|nr:putative Kunitz-type serine protease inhibitor [Pollicipes pollicipes]